MKSMESHTLDIGMNRLEVAIADSVNFWYSSRIIDLGDLSTYYGYETFDASGYTIIPGKMASGILSGPAELNATDVRNMLKSGNTYIVQKTFL